MEKNIKKIVKESFSKSEVARKLGYNYCNGHVLKIVTKLIKDNKLNIDHFSLIPSRSKYDFIEQECPVCGKIFEVKNNKRNQEKPKITCSHSCSNTYFRSGKNNPNWKGSERKEYESEYRRICFKYHKKECVICEEKNIVAVHHYDKNNKNNKPKNLIPLCPTHHVYIHSKYATLIEKDIEKYIKNLKF